MELILIISLVLVYSLGALLSLKLDDVWTERPSDYSIGSIFIALIFWVPVSIWMLLSKHTTWEDKR